MTVHKVELGECLATIAKHYHFPRWQTIYEAPENESFRQKRPNPNVIYEGDEITIPDKRLKDESGETEKKHRHKVKRSKWMFRVEIRDEAHKGLEGVPYELRIEGMAPIKKKTGINGLIKTPIPAEARRGTLLFQGETIELNFGGLDPVTRLSGIQQRLNNLGFKADPAGQRPGRRTRKAVAAFQSAHKGLKPTGEIDDATRKKLLEVHDNDKQVCDAEEEMSCQQDEEPANACASPGPGGAEDVSFWDDGGGMVFDRQRRIFFAIYYYVPDRAFERAAMTWQRELEAGPSFHAETDEFIGIEVVREGEFKDAWATIQARSEAEQAVIVEGHIFVHASIHGASETGVEFKADSSGATLTHAEALALPKLVWDPQKGLLVHHGCNSGLPSHLDKEISARSFAMSQKIVAIGQGESAYLSSSQDTYVKTNETTTVMYLWGYEHGKFHPFGSGAKIPGIVFKPDGTQGTAADIPPRD